MCKVMKILFVLFFDLSPPPPIIFVNLILRAPLIPTPGAFWGDSVDIINLCQDDMSLIWMVPLLSWFSRLSSHITFGYLISCAPYVYLLNSLIFLMILSIHVEWVTKICCVKEWQLSFRYFQVTYLHNIWTPECILIVQIHIPAFWLFSNKFMSPATLTTLINGA